LGVTVAEANRCTYRRPKFLYFGEFCLDNQIAN